VGVVEDALLAAGLVPAADADADADADAEAAAGERAGSGSGTVPEDLVSPATAWRLVASGSVTPTATVPYDAPDQPEAVNVAWRDLADRRGLLSGRQREFLVTFAIPGSAPTGWVRVRGGDRIDLAPFGPRPGRPEVVALSLDGEQLLAATCEEHDVWLVALSSPARMPLARRCEADRSTPAERSRQLEGLRRLRSLGPERVAQLSGLAANPAAPDDVLLRILTALPACLRPWDFLRSRELSDELFAAVLVHPDRRVRHRVVENRHLTAEQRLVLLTDQDERVRHLATVFAADQQSALPEEILLSLSREENPRIRQEAALLPTTSAEVAALRARDASALVRRNAVERDWLPSASEQKAAAPIDNPHPMADPALPHHVMRELIQRVEDESRP
jgi:hypothetical protein